MARPRPQRLQAEAVQQVVDRLQAAEHAKLLLEDAADVFAAERADAVGRGRPRQDAPLEALLLLGSQRPLAAPALFVEQAVGPAGVVAADPGADLAGGEQDVGADLLGGLPQQGQPDGGQSPRHLGVRLGADAGGQFLGGKMRLDVHGAALLPGLVRIGKPPLGSYFIGCVLLIRESS